MSRGRRIKSINPVGLSAGHFLGVDSKHITVQAGYVVERRMTKAVHSLTQMQFSDYSPAPIKVFGQPNLLFQSGL
jgi:hypothetical protein